MDNKKQIEEIAEVIYSYLHSGPMSRALAVLLCGEGFCKRSDVVSEFAERLKEAPIKCGLPLLGLSTKGEIEEYFNDILIQVRDAIDDLASKMKDGE